MSLRRQLTIIAYYIQFAKSILKKNPNKINGNDTFCSFGIFLLATLNGAKQLPNYTHNCTQNRKHKKRRSGY
jgi:hypothetical protein